MRRFSYRFTALSLAALLCLTLSACSSTPETADDEPPVSLGSAEDLIQSPDVLMATQFHVDALDDLAPLIGAAPISTPGIDMAAIERFSSDPVGYFSRITDVDQPLSALHTDRPTYAMITSAGHANFIDALRMGLPTFEEEWPAYINLRVLLPTDDPATLEEELGPFLEALPDLSEVGAVQAFDGPNFLRLEIALDLQLPYDAETPADQWLDELRLDQLQPPATADFRPTEAYLSFVDDQATMGLWGRTADVSSLGAMELWHDFATSYHRVAPEGQPRYFLHGVARMAASGAVNDPVAAEFEDMALSAHRGEDNALVLDLVGTRTAHGARLQEANIDAATLPVPDLDDAFFDLRVAATYQALRDQLVDPLWTTLDSDIDAGAQDLMATSGSVLPFMEDDAALPVLAALAQYPQAFLAFASEEFEGLFPVPNALSVHGFLQGPEAFMPLGVVASASFEDAPQTRAAIEQLLTIGESNFPGTFDAELLSRSGDRLELRFALGATLEDAFDADVADEPIDQQSISLDLSALSELDGMVPEEADDVDLLDHLHLRSHSQRSYTSMRATLGSPNAQDAPRVAGDDITPLDPGSRCTAEIPLIAIEYLANLQARPEQYVDQWAQAMEGLAPDCLDPTSPVMGQFESRIDRAYDLVDQIP